MLYVICRLTLTRDVYKNTLLCLLKTYGCVFENELDMVIYVCLFENNDASLVHMCILCASVFYC